MKNGTDSMGMAEQVEHQVRLQIVVSRHCTTCEESRSIALQMREMFPRLQVDLIDLEAGHPVPESVVAAPTYLLDCTVVSLGNPRPEDLVTKITVLQALREWLKVVRVTEDVLPSPRPNSTVRAPLFA